MFRLTSIALAATLCLPAAELAKPDIRTVALEIPTGVSVRIKTIGKQTVQGKLVAITSEGVSLQMVEKDQIAERSMPFSDMKSIRQTNKPMSAGKVVLLAIGVTYGILVIIGIAIGG